jgi:2-C-methyl-D-erythritol 4-phosphate cytidylyltransferase
VFRSSKKVNIFEGKPDNIKITSQNDLTLFKFFLNFKNK